MAPADPVDHGRWGRRRDADDAHGYGGNGADDPTGSRRRAGNSHGSECRKRSARDVGESRDRRRSRTPGEAGTSRRRHRSPDGDRRRDSSRRGRREAGGEGERAPRHSRGDDGTERPRRRAGRGHENDGGGNDGSGPQKDGGAVVRRRGPLPSQEASYAVDRGDEADEADKAMEKANYGATGALAAMSNSVQRADGTSVALKYHEPPEARKPAARDEWKLYVFKGSDVVDTVNLSLKSCWLIGRDASVVDLLAEHPSISKQHAVVQFRYRERRNEFGDKVGRVKPYLLDLESANGTILNDGPIPDSRYLELRNKDVLRFGDSTREYVVMLAPRE